MQFDRQINKVRARAATRKQEVRTGRKGRSMRQREDESLGPVHNHTVLVFGRVMLACMTTCRPDHPKERAAQFGLVMFVFACAWACDACVDFLHTT